MEAKIYNQKGKEVGSIKLSESIFAVPWNSDLVNQVVVSMMGNKRTPVAHSRDRSEVSGGGKKPWKQKGTGRARHGSSRSPIWIGGGVTHGPRNEKDYSRKINRKMKARALTAILSKKFELGELVFVDKFEFAAPKTKEAREVLSAIADASGNGDLKTKRKNSALIALGSKNENTEKSFSNMGNVIVDEARNIDPLRLFNTKYLIIENPSETLEFLESKLK
ncbi:MAG: 50S ribosomal protein L4 [Parcubacteria group bacterium CG11_big_fil_rev_8_21_14_0_20_39_22]|nr:MAG: 50S ribosomal protein L4 [Parcubacteria group bacterium CG11_big_fil_rev_8_21_14_0_20_39_22]